MESEKSINRDLILRERLALQRTTLANQSTFLAFLRTAMYFFIAGLSVNNLLKVEHSFFIEISFFVSSFLILIIGIISYLREKKRIRNNEKNIGNYKVEYF